MKHKHDSDCNGQLNFSEKLSLIIKVFLIFAIYIFAIFGISIFLTKIGAATVFYQIAGMLLGIVLGYCTLRLIQHEQRNIK